MTKFKESLLFFNCELLITKNNKNPHLQKRHIFLKILNTSLELVQICTNPKEINETILKICDFLK